MLQLFKQLIVISVLAAGVFYLARPIAVQFTLPADYVRRRNLWLGLSAIAFLSPNYWLYVLLAGIVLVTVARKDSNPAAIYLLLMHVLPPNGLSIPSPVELFDLDNYRLLSLTVLLPLFFRLRKQSVAELPNRALALPDYLLIGFGVLATALFVPPDLPGHVLLQDSPTNMVRRAVLYFLDTYVLYYTMSRGFIDRRKLIDACLSLMLGLSIMAAIGAFESARNWMLYDGLFARWSDTMHTYMYLLRGASLRAMAAAGQSLVLGVTLAVGFGMWVALRPIMKTRVQMAGSAGLIWLGLLASYSRGPWIGAIFMYVVYVVVSARSLGPILKGGAAVVATIGILLVSPLGDKVKDVLPFFGGKVDNFNVLYRQRLAARSWELIWQHPLFGDQLAYTKMDDLRQGEGIVDLVNSYAGTALFYGLVGVLLLYGFAVVAVYRALMRARSLASTDPQLAAIGFGLVATMAGELMMLYATSFINGPEKLYFSLAACASAFLYVKTQSPAAATVRREPVRSASSLKPWAPR